MLLSPLIAFKIIEKKRPCKDALFFGLDVWALTLVMITIGITVAPIIGTLLITYFLARYGFKSKRPVAITIATLVISIILSMVILFLGLALLGTVFLASIVS